MRYLVAICFVFLVVSVTIPHAFATTKHGCAPQTPPAVPGVLVQPPATPGLLLINEVLLNPHSVWNCSESTASTQKDLWVEFYNPQNQAFDLSSVHPTLDGGVSSFPFYLPSGAAIPAHGFLVVFPGVLQFLNTQALTLRLMISGIIIDQVTIPPLEPDQSYARFPDGSKTWQLMGHPTIDASNTLALATVTPTPRTQKANSKGQNGSSSSSKSKSSSTSTGSSGIDQNQPVDGAQPTWTALQLPSSTALPTASPVSPADSSLTNVTPGTPTPASNNNNMDLLKKILLTAVVVVLALAFFWYRRLLTKT